VSSTVSVSRVRLVPAGGVSRSEGVVGWVSFATPDGLLVDGIALRVSRVGRPVFSWPARRDRAGRDHHVVRPLDDAARQEIEQQLLAQLAPWLREGSA